MKKFFYILTAVFFLSLATNAMAETQFIDSYKCSTKIFKKGSHDFEVEKNCGAPVSKDLVGYTDGKVRLKIEKWVYGPRDGKMFVLYFKAGILEKIESYKP